MEPGTVFGRWSGREGARWVGVWSTCFRQKEQKCVRSLPGAFRAAKEAGGAGAGEQGRGVAGEDAGGSQARTWGPVGHGEGLGLLASDMGIQRTLAQEGGPTGLMF